MITGWLIILALGALIWGTVLFIRRPRTPGAKLRLVGSNAGPSKNAGAHGSHGGGFLKQLTIGKVLVGGTAAIVLLIVIVCLLHPIRTVSHIGAAASRFLVGPEVVNASGQPLGMRTPTSAGDKTCPLFDADQRESCWADKTVIVMIPSGVAGKVTCWSSPFKPDEHLQVFLMDGTVKDFGPAVASLPAEGFRFTPAPKHPRELNYWLADGQCA